MTTVAPEQLLQDTMTKLESALLAPVVSGEMESWVLAVQQAAATFAMDLTTHLRTVLHAQYEQIANTDSELSACVEKMIQTDNELLEELACFHEKLHDLQQAASHVDWQEGKLAGQRHNIEQTGIGIILRIKKQQSAATTWLAEAVYRDRGVGD
jgi:mevalonate kinase